MKNRLRLLPVIFIFLLIGCKTKDKTRAGSNDAYTPKPYVELKHHTGTYTDWFAGTQYVWKGDDEMKLDAWGYSVLVK